MTKPFQFKQFAVHQDLCAMKIGTDGVLLGAWTSLENRPESVLDIGAGTGIISLQLAQRSKAKRIDALEIDKNAFEQCSNNFKDSPWGDRLKCFHTSFEKFLKESTAKYDLVVSNPPFYVEDFKTGNELRDVARFSSALPLENLVKGTRKLMNVTGIFSVIVPKSREKECTTFALAENLHLQKRTDVKGNKKSTVKRSLLQFGFDPTICISNKLIIENSRHEYTVEYIALTREFYLKM